MFGHAVDHGWTSMTRRKPAQKSAQEPQADHSISPIAQSEAFGGHSLIPATLEIPDNPKSLTIQQIGEWCASLENLEAQYEHYIEMIERLYAAADSTMLLLFEMRRNTVPPMFRQRPPTMRPRLHILERQ